MIEVNSVLPIKQLSSLELIWKEIEHSNEIKYIWFGKQPFRPIWELQKKLQKLRKENRISNMILFLEHEHVYTFGKNANRNYLLDSKSQDADIVQIDRGGEVTYHGPGQLVVYPILDLCDFNKSISWYMRSLESVVIHTLDSLGIIGHRKEKLTGVWVNDDKICAMGVRLSKWVTMHGFALNLNPNMKYFDGIIPCGIFDLGITSISELNVDISMDMLVEQIKTSFNIYFNKEEYEV